MVTRQWTEIRVFREIEYLPGNFFRSIVSKLLEKEIFRQAVEDESLGQGLIASMEVPANPGSRQASFTAWQRRPEATYTAAVRGKSYLQLKTAAVSKN